MRNYSTPYLLLFCFALIFDPQPAVAQHVAANFEQLPPVTANFRAYTLATADLNHDGKLDLIVGIRDTNQMAVLLGKGDGTFQSPSLTFVGPGDFLTGMVVADFNEDGNPDVVAIQANSGTANILLGNGDGSFQAPQLFPTGVSPISATAGDIDNDGHFDLFVFGNGSSSVILGVGNGTFKPTPVSLNSFVGFTFAPPLLGDINGDGKLDVILPDSLSNCFAVFFGNGDGSFQVKQSFTNGGFPVTQIASADLNADGKADIMILSNPGNAITPYLVGVGGTLASTGNVFAGAVPVGLEVLDVDGDGQLDIVTGAFSSSKMEVLYGDGTGHFPYLSEISLGSKPSVFVTGNFNADGGPDFVFFGGPSSSDLYVLLQTSKEMSSTTVSSSLNPTNLAQEITLTATVTSSFGIPSGSVSFKNGPALLGTSTLDANGVAVLTTTSVPAGLHSIIAAYNGDTTFGRSVSSVLVQTVRDTTVNSDVGVSIQPSGDTAFRGGPFSFTIKFTNNGPIPITFLNLTNTLSGPSASFGVSRSQGVTCTGTVNLVCSLASLGVGANATVTLSGIVIGTGTLTSSASVFALQSDNVSANDSATASIFVSNPTPVLTSVSPASSSTGAAPLLITIAGGALLSDSQVLWNGVPLATQFVNSNTLNATIPSSELLTMRTSKVSVSNPAPGGGLSAEFEFVTYRSLHLSIKDMVYDPFRKRIFATVDRNSPDPNAIYEIDPFAGTVDSKTFIGSGPNRIVESDDGQKLYVGLDGAFAVRDLDPQNLIPGHQFSLGVDSTFSTQPARMAAQDIAVMPGSNDSLAVGTLGQFAGNTFIFDSGVARPNPVGQTNLPAAALNFAGNPSTLFGIGNGFNAGGLVKASVDANGLTLVNVVPAVPSARRSVVTGNKLFLDNAVVADLNTLSVSTIPQIVQANVAADAGHAYYLSGWGPVTIKAYDPGSLQQTGNFTINGFSDVYFRPFVRWGEDGFAFVNRSYPDNQDLILVRSGITGVQSQSTADLSLAFSSSPDTFDVGALVPLTATISNAGPQAASNAVVSFGIPANWTVTNVNSAVGTCNSAPPIVCKIGTLAASVTASLSITLRPDSAGAVTVAARVESPESDPVQANNTALAQITVNPGIPLNPVPTVRAAYYPFTTLSSLPEGSAGNDITVNGDHFVPGSIAQWNGQNRPTTYQNPQFLTMSLTTADLATYGANEVSVLNPAPGGGTSSKVLFDVVRKLNVVANAMVYDVFRNKFYAAVSSSSGTNPNSIITIDPSTGAISNPIAVGTEPRQLIITGNGQFLYFATDDTNTRAVKQLDIGPGTLTTVFSNSGVFQDYVSVLAIAPVPGRSDSTVLLQQGPFFSPLLAVYDQGTKRVGTVTTDIVPQGTPNGVGFDSARRLYSGRQKFSLTGSGVAGGAYVPNSIGAFNYDGGHLFYYGGAIANSDTLEQEAQLTPSGAFSYLYEGLGDAGAQRAYYRALGGSFNSIRIFDTTSYQELAQIQAENPVQIFHWDTDKLAYINGPSYQTPANISFLRSPVVAGVTGNPRPAVSSLTPESTALNGPDFTLTVTGVNFVSGSLLRWNGVALTTTFISGTHLSATVPSNQLSQPGAAYVSVFNPLPAGGESNLAMVKVVPSSISIDSLTPNVQGMGHLDFPVTVNGQNFTPDSVVNWNGSARVTTFVSNSKLTALIKAADVAALGTANITVSDWIAGASGPSIFTIAAAPLATLTPTYLNFGSQKIGTASAAMTTTLTNSGNGPLQINSISASSPFHATSNCASSLAVGASCTVSVQVSPIDYASYNASLIIDSNSSAPPTTVNLFAVGGLANLVLNFPNATFAPQTLFSTSNAQYIGLSNQGTFPLTIQGVAATGDFKVVSSSCPASLDRFMGCGIDVQFRPTAIGQRSGSLIITSDAPGSPHTVTLSGFANDLVLTLVRPSRSTRNTRAQSTAQREAAQIHVSGLSSDPVHLSCGALPRGSRCQFSAQDFSLHGTLPVTVSIAGAGENRSIRLRTGATATHAMRLRNDSDSDSSLSTLNVLITATSGSLQRSITVPIVMQ